MFSSKQIKTVKIIDTYTEDKYPPDSDRTFHILEIVMSDNSRNKITFTDKEAMWWYGDYFTQEDLNKYYHGKKGFVFNPAKTAAIGVGAIIGGLTYGGFGLFAGAITGYAIPNALKQLNDFYETNKKGAAAPTKN